MSDYITWKKLKRRWKKLDFQLLEYLQKGLQPYFRHGNVFRCKFRHHKYSHLHELQFENKQFIKTLENNPDYDDLVADILPSGPDNGPKKSVEERIKELEKNNLNISDEMTIIKEKDPDLDSWEYFINPGADGVIDEIISDLKETIFKMKDVLEFEKIHDLGKTIKKKTQTEGRKNTISKRADADIEEHLESSIQAELKENGKIKIISFYKSGDIWWIGEKGKELQFKPLKGFEYMHFLIRNKNKKFHALEVYHLGNVPPDLEKQMTEQQQQLEKLSDNKFETGLLQLKEDLSNEMDLEKRFEIKDKIEKLKDYQKIGKYSFKKENDKCRVNVYASTKKAVKVIHEKFKKPGDKDIIKLFNVGSLEIIKSGIIFYYREELIDFDIQWQLDPE